MILILLLLVLIAVIGYLIYKKQLTWPIQESPLYKLALVKFNECQEKCKKCQEAKKAQKPKTDQETAPTKTEKPAEGTHVPKPKGDKPVIEDRPNGKKEVVSGDKSILIDEIQSKHYAKLSKKHDEIEEAKQAWLKARDAKEPDVQAKHDVFQKKKQEFEDLKYPTHKAVFDEVNIYMNIEDCIDLHGLQIEGAIMMMKEQIELRKKQGKKILKCQCGMGHHNTVGFSKIKEEVVKQLKEMGEKFTEDKEHGFVNVDL